MSNYRKRLNTNSYWRLRIAFSFSYYLILFVCFAFCLYAKLKLKSRHSGLLTSPLCLPKKYTIVFIHIYMISVANVQWKPNDLIKAQRGERMKLIFLPQTSTLKYNSRIKHVRSLKMFWKNKTKRKHIRKRIINQNIIN